VARNNEGNSGREPDRRWAGQTEAVLLTLSTSMPDAADLGFLLFKHPDKAQSFSVGPGTRPTVAVLR
jgi:hypothetical protein